MRDISGTLYNKFVAAVFVILSTYTGCIYLQVVVDGASIFVLAKMSKLKLTFPNE